MISYLDMVTFPFREGKRRRGKLRMRWLDSITDSVDVYLSKLGR